MQQTFELTGAAGEPVNDIARTTAATVAIKTDKSDCMELKYNRLNNYVILQTRNKAIVLETVEDVKNFCSNMRKFADSVECMLSTDITDKKHLTE